MNIGLGFSGNFVRLAWFLYIGLSLALITVFFGHLPAETGLVIFFISLLPMQLLLVRADKVWFRQEGLETGPVSVKEVGRLHRDGKLSAAAEAQSHWSQQWTPFTVVSSPPARLAHGLMGAFAGLILGTFLGHALFGRVNTPLDNGINIDIALILEKPTPRGNPLFVTAVREGATIAGDSGIPVVNVAGKLVQATDAVVQEHNNAIYRAIDRIRGCMAAAALLAGIFFSRRAEERYRLVRSERVAAPLPSSKPQELKPEVATNRIVFECLQCGKRLAAPSRRAGEPIKCPACATPQQVPLDVA